MAGARLVHLLNDPKRVFRMPRRRRGCLHRNFCDFAAMLLFDPRRIIYSIAANAGAGKTGRGQKRSPVHLEIDIRTIRQRIDKS